MKINRIAFENINSLRGKHEIDFTTNPLEDSRLFAIIGPTGSGKSTILDVISLALFNEVSRLGKISRTVIEQSGAILTRNQEECFASVEYECARGHFRSTWSISTNRNGNLREYDMKIENLETGQPLDVGRGQVRAQNEELIGLSYSQFNKAILLAQGEFSKFLKESKKDRGLLLEKITGTSIYRKLGVKAFEKKRILAKALTEYRERLSIVEEDKLPEEELAAQSTHEQELAKTINKQEKKRQGLDEQLKLHLKKDSLESEKSKLQEALTKAEESLNLFKEEKATILERHEATAPFAQELLSFQQGNNLIKAEQENRKKIKAKIAAAQGKLEILSQKVKALVKEEAKDEELYAVLDRFQARVVELEEAWRAKQADFDQKFPLLTERLRPLKFIVKKNSLRADQTELKIVQERLLNKQKELEQTLQDLDLANPAELQDTLDYSLEKLREGKVWAAELDSVLQKLQEEKSTLESKKKEISGLPEIIKDLGHQQELLRQNQKLLELKRDNQNLIAQLEDHRHKLEDGKPCPLCGGLEHPWALEAPEQEDAVQSELDRLQEQYLKITKEHSNQEALLNSFEKEIPKVEERIKERVKRQQELEQSIKDYCAPWMKEGHVDWEAEIQKLNNQKGALRNWLDIQVKTNALNDALPLLDQVMRLQEEEQEALTAKRAVFSGNNIQATCEELRSDWRSARQDLDGNKEDLIALEAASEQLQSAQKALETSLSELVQEAQFASISEAIEARLSDLDYQTLNKKHQELLKAVDDHTGSLKHLQKQLIEIVEELGERSREELQIEQSQLEDDLKTQKEEWGQLKLVLAKHNEALVKAKEIQDLIEKEEVRGRKWELLDNLIGDATGNKFNDFAQDLTLRQLLGLANKRLVQLNDRYWVATAEENEADGLVAIDKHMGGQRRSVKTLSGGETFILSLALALALSDLAARNVQINSLFIDEGFGTLDPDTLDQTIDTLEKLQLESDKTIGVISHVEALKERINTQIKLSRDGQGFSKMEVV